MHNEFLRHWFTRNFNEYCTELGYHLITADGRQIEKEIVLQKIQVFFDAFIDFRDDGYNIHEIKFELHEDDYGLGHAEGMLKYDAVMGTGKLYITKDPINYICSVQINVGNIFYFVMPGFVW